MNLLTCPACRHAERTDQPLLGRQVRCPACSAVFRVTDAEFRRDAGPSREPAARIPTTECISEQPIDRPRPATTEFWEPGDEPRPPARQREAKAEPRSSRLRSWTHAALGFAGALILVGLILVAVNLSGRSSRDDAKPAAPLPAKPAAQLAREQVIDRGKRASALVQVAVGGDEISGSAFCIDKSGLFVTNAHVIEKLYEAPGRLRIVVDIGLPTQRAVDAKVRRADDYLDLALLEVPADSRFEVLELGDDRSLSETTPVMAFGFPLGEGTRYGKEQYPNCSVISGKVTTFHGPRDKRDGVQFDGQINPGQSGGPVLDESGRVIGVAVATMPGKQMNLAVPVSRLSGFLDAPGVAFTHGTLAYHQRSQPVRWSIRLEAPRAGGKVPDDLSVRVTIAHSKDDRRVHDATRAPDGTYRVEVTPVPNGTRTPVPAILALVEARKGEQTVATILRVLPLAGAPVPRVVQADEPELYIIRTLRPQTFGPFGRRLPGIGPYGPYGPRIPGLGPMGPRMGRRGEDVIVVVPDRTPRRIVRTPAGPDDQDILTVGGRLSVTGRPKGAGKSIRVPALSIPEARVAPGAGASTEVRKIRGHTDEVLDVAITPDGQKLVSASSDATVRVWDAKTGRVLRVLKGHEGPVRALAISPDGKRLLSGGADKILRLWDIDTGQLVREYPGHGDSIFAIAFTPDGRRCLSAGGGFGPPIFPSFPGFRLGTDRAIWVRDLADGRVLARWAGHNGIIDALAVSPDGRLALSSATDKTVRIWDVARGAEVLRLAGHRQELFLDAIFSPDGRRAIVTSQVSGQRPETEDGSVIRIFDVKTGSELHELRGHKAKVDSLAASPDGRILVSGSNHERILRLWDLADGRPLGQIALEANPQLGTFSPDGRRIFWAFSDRTIREFALPDSSLATRQPGAPGPGAPLVHKTADRISDVAVGGGGRYLCLKLNGRKLAIFDANAGAVVKTIPLEADRALIAAGASLLIVAYPDQRAFVRWSLDDLDSAGTRVNSPLKAQIQSLAMGNDSDGPLLACWTPGPQPQLGAPARYSFLDPRTFAVLKADSIINGGVQGIGQLSRSGGSLTLHPFLQKRVHLRASAGGNLFALWQTSSTPSGFQTLRIEGAALRGIYNHDGLNHLAPGPDGRSVYTGRGGIRDGGGKPIALPGPTQMSPVIAIPSADPAYDLAVAGLTGPNQPTPGVSATEIIVSRTNPREALFRITGLDEMAAVRGDESTIAGELTMEKRFHLIPAPNLLITVPDTDDRLVLRRIDVAKAIRETRNVTAATDRRGTETSW